MIKDSGERREFESGAVRDIQEGKGRCDLLPLDVVAAILSDDIIGDIYKFTVTGDSCHLFDAIDKFITCTFESKIEAIMALSRHFEEGCKKYGERNWEKGIPCHCFVDSGIRHYLKFKSGLADEPHDRAFLWNMVCLLWTVEHRKLCNDLPFAKKGEGLVDAKSSDGRSSAKWIINL